MTATDYDIILAGGGLANGLIADRLLAARPDLRLLIVDQEAALGGNHTWSFHETDVSAEQLKWLAPYVAHRWSKQEVRFNGLTRVLKTGYCCIPSERFDNVLRQRLGSQVRLNATLVDVSPQSVTLASQQCLTAACVIDGRGPRADPALALGFQKFIGREIETTAPHGLSHPIIMDATVSQDDGYRFVYTLPLDPCRLLIEDTYYSDMPGFDLNHISRGIDAYALSQGWHSRRMMREESGVLPIVLAGDIDAYWARDVDLPRVGLRAALFHPTTGYSLPDAVMLAEKIAAAMVLTSNAIAAIIRAHSKDQWHARGFFRLLNRMLFLAASGSERAVVLARFYTLPEPLIQRFYAGRPTVADKVRILSGKPPVPFMRALPCLGTSGAWAFARANGKPT
jgi:lycopene beta-cyclase